MKGFEGLKKSYFELKIVYPSKLALEDDSI